MDCPYEVVDFEEPAWEGHIEFEFVVRPAFEEVEDRRQHGPDDNQVDSGLALELNDARNVLFCMDERLKGHFKMDD